MKWEESDESKSKKVKQS